MNPGTIFISHRAEYGGLVRELKKAIETTSRGKIKVFISEDMPGAEKWRTAIKSQLANAENLFLVYGAAYEDWSWCFYEAGFFAGIDAAAGDRARRIYCIARPNVPVPGPLNDLQIVTDKEKLIADLMKIYDDNGVDYDATTLRDSIDQAAKGLFRKLEEFVSYPRVYFTANDADFGARLDLPPGAELKGDKTLLTQLFGIGKDAVLWDEIIQAAAVDRTAQERVFFSKWADETKRIILAARQNKFIAPQTVLIVRGGMRYRFLLYQARIQGDGSYSCEFLVINDVGGPTLGLSQQQLALLTSIRMGFRFRYELFEDFPDDLSALPGEERRERIQELLRIIDNLMTESNARGNITLPDLKGAFGYGEAARIGKLVVHWRTLMDHLYDALRVSADGTAASDRGPVEPDLERYRIAFESLRLINLEFLSRCCSCVSKMMMQPEDELKKNAAVIENNVRALSRVETRSAA